MHKNYNNMENLKFRRQFLFTAKRCDELKNWDIENLETHYLYTHPDCEVTKVRTVNFELILIGYILDPRKEESTNLDILNDVSNASTIDDISKKLYSLVGRFVLLIKKDNTYTFFHDACGLKILFYTKFNEELYVASQPLLLELVTDINKGEKYKEYYASKYIKENLEHWIPSGASLYDKVYQLVPNHYLDSVTYKQVRYWPNKQLGSESLENTVNELSVLLKKTMNAANKRFKLALTMTAGWDSRILLSSSKDFKEDIWSYTQKYRQLEDDSEDIRVPLSLSEKFGFEHTVMDGNISIDDDFLKIYESNTDIPHINDWGKIAYGTYLHYPSERVAVKGNCSEVGRCNYFKPSKKDKVTSSSDFLIFEQGWEDIDFIKQRIAQWHEELSKDNTSYGYNLYDLFFWEHRIGSWQAQGQLEWDMVQETFTPFNNREILDIILRVDTKYRCPKSNIIFKKAIEKLWPETLVEPINYLTIRQRAKNILKKMLLKMGVFNILKSILSK